MHSTTVVPPFYDLEPGAPPPLPPMLTDQLELFGNANCHPTTLIANEILVPQASIIPTAARALSSTPAPEFKLAKRMVKHSDCSSSPYTKKIVTPQLERHGGYTLCEALDWNPKAYAKFKKSMHSLIEGHLDTTKCTSAQSPTLLEVVHGKALDNFPDLDNYNNLWPVNDMIMTRLKYTSGCVR
ncbi:hypothetical protein DFJ58DRAFT_838193 [Suillus subalutaceus]|uniref:uncharacterized protein n=1 Tax=Suillus subalutaceus TaxID=48586 RepID=UPI001B85E88E|nr:uncharacterized protein DFJ58DRAFT_838193 [Suillus subalutaceus]KAG1867183.1 hypothetical protein DFJ58DRAFT_838193 [Suillus subalutaceus]